MVPARRSVLRLVSKTIPSGCAGSPSSYPSADGVACVVLRSVACAIKDTPLPTALSPTMPDRTGAWSWPNAVASRGDLLRGASMGPPRVRSLEFPKGSRTLTELRRLYTSTL